MPLHWAVYLARDGGERRSCTKTRDISPEGFYCLINQSVEVGEYLDCDIVIPAYNLKKPEEVIQLHCRVQAARVERMDSGDEFGLACRIKDYRVIRGTCEPLLVHGVQDAEGFGRHR